MAITAMTTSNSISVKASRFLMVAALQRPPHILDRDAFITGAVLFYGVSEPDTLKNFFGSPNVLVCATEPSIAIWPGAPPSL